MRSILYTLAKLMGDYNAIKKGNISSRIFNRLIGKATGRLFK